MEQFLRLSKHADRHTLSPMGIKFMPIMKEYIKQLRHPILQHHEIAVTYVESGLNLHFSAYRW
jgi:hypothetical protein